MKPLLNVRRSFLTLLMIIGVALGLIKCIDRGNKQHNLPGDAAYNTYAGSEKCAQCHRPIYDSFATTGHFLSSHVADKQHMRGNFNDSNVFRYTAEVFVKMTDTDSGYYEIKNERGTETSIGRIDIIIGSGILGQTYLSWKGNHLYQLPVSYLTSVNEWVNNPGAANFLYESRTISASCLECHATYAGGISPGLDGPFFDPHQIIYGVGCEKCHGPGQQHVDFELQNKQGGIAKNIINPATFSRQQSLDLCRSCHGGRRKNIRAPFTFRPGDTLSKFYAVNDHPNTLNIDVHGDQYDLLAESKCFKSSQLTCLNCHDPHANERNKFTLFSQRCMSCHNEQHGSFCTLKSVSSDMLKTNCIDCHMPAERSKIIVMKMTDSAKMKPALLRTHLITVYPDATKKFLANMAAIFPKK